jgi:hypothetical protein
MTRSHVIELPISEQAACRHERRGWVVLETANGVEQVRRACLDCGWRAKRSHSHRQHPDRGHYPLVLPRQESRRQA